VLAVVQGRSVAASYRDEEMSRLQEAGRAIRHDIDAYLDYHLRALMAIREVQALSDNPSPEPLQQLVSARRKIYPGFQTLLFTDVHGATIAIESERADGTSYIPAPNSIGDRDYFQKASATGKPYISEVLLGR